MPSVPNGPAHAGISLGPDRGCAVLWRDGTVERVWDRAREPGDIEKIIAAVIRVGAGRVDAVTVDLSRLLMGAVTDESVDLGRIAVIRIVPRPASDPVLSRSPARLVERLIAERATVAGGHDLLGNELCPLDRVGLAAVAAELAAAAVPAVAVVGAGSQARPVHEREVADAVQAGLPDARISVASDFGGQGLVAREATVALDCALGPLTEEVVGRCQRALARSAPAVALRVARGDGGHCTPARVRALPVVALGAFDALIISGAAHRAGLLDCRVLLPRPDGQLAGDVRRGLVAVRSGELSPVGVELMVPVAALSPDPGDGTAAEVRRSTDVPVLLAAADPAELACLGAAVSRPTSWLDEFAYIGSAAELEKVRRETQDRARAIVMANGAAPGSAFLVEVSSVAVPYSPPGTVRIRVRMAGEPDTDPRRVAVTDRMAP